MEMWESRVLCEISKSLWKPLLGFHRDVISIAVFAAPRPRSSSNPGEAVPLPARRSSFLAPPTRPRLSGLPFSIGIGSQRRRRGTSGPGRRRRRDESGDGDLIAARDRSVRSLGRKTTDQDAPGTTIGHRVDIQHPPRHARPERDHAWAFVPRRVPGSRIVGPFSVSRCA